MDVDYLMAVKEAMVDQDVINRQKDLNIVYSPLHGTGRVIIPAALRTWGFQNIHVVAEQMVVDGNFPTVVSPNPENSEAMTMGMNLGTKLNADLVIASDPDADRLAIVCRNDKGEWEILNGNQTAMMFSWYIITNKKKLGQLKGNEFMVKTIVTSELIADIARKNNVLMDGRDIGTTVFPDAELKIFVTASPQIRAQRRLDEMRAKGNNEVTFEEVLFNVEERDRIDQTRAVSPLRKADDALVLDNSEMTIAQQNEWLMNEFKKRTEL